MSQTLVALYENSNTAQQVVNALVTAGFDRANITVDPSIDSTSTTSHSSSEQGNQGGIGGFFDRLFGLDVPEEEAGVYAESVRRGNYGVTVTVNDADVDAAEDILGDFNPIDTDYRAQYLRESGWTGYDRSAPLYDESAITTDRESYRAAENTYRTLNAGESARLDVVEEELQVGKRQVEGGGVRIRSIITERPVEANVTLREERVTVQRNTVDRAATSADFDTFEEGTIEVTEMSEEAVIGKTARVVEEVVVGKEATEHTETVSDTVRRKDVDVEQIPASERTSTTTSTTYTTNVDADIDDVNRSNR